LLNVSRQDDGQLEIFRSIQGEGISAGMPAVFLRLAFCNLRCDWCDTKYTWDWKHYDRREQVIEKSAQEIGRLLLLHDCKHLVVTGGEPLVQQKELTKLLAYLKDNGFYIEIETNGTIVPHSDLSEIVDQWNVSPKLRNSGNPQHLREIPGAYMYFAKLPCSYFKYVIQTESDLGEVKELMSRYSMPRERVILMPEAADRLTLLRRGRWLVRICREQGFKFSSRLHILLWGGQRGV